jgi:hypothetical protein
MINPTEDVCRQTEKLDKAGKSEGKLDKVSGNTCKGEVSLQHEK